MQDRDGKTAGYTLFARKSVFPREILDSAVRVAPAERAASPLKIHFGLGPHNQKEVQAETKDTQ